MGDRAAIICHDGERTCGVGTYVHWLGKKSVELLEEALPTLRKGNASYSQARITAFFCSKHEPPYGVGVFSVPKLLTDLTGEENPGDAGVVLFNVKTGVAYCYGGYLTGVAKVLEMPAKAAL